MAKNQEGFFRSMDSIDVMEEVVAVGANIAGGVTGAWVMTKGLDKFSKKSTENPTDPKGPAVPEYDKPIIPKAYQPWITMTIGVLGRTFITNPQLASFFGGMATIAGTKGVVEMVFEKTKADYGFAGLGEAYSYNAAQQPQIIETTANTFEDFDAVADAARNAAIQVQETNPTTTMSGVESGAAVSEDVMVN